MPGPEIIHPSELSAGDAAGWGALQSATPAFASPLLGPDFARAVGEVRRDARVAIWREGGAPVAVLAHHRRPGGFARPIGAPFCDYQALVARPDFALTGAEALATAGLGAYRACGLVDVQGRFADVGLANTPAYRIVRDATDASEAGAPPRPWSANRLKNYRRYSRKLEAAFGPLRLVVDTDPAAFERLLDWKQRQLRRSGLHDFLRLGWTQRLMRRLFETRGAPFAGLMLTLYAGDRHLAGHFGVRLHGHYHPWIGAMDPDASGFSAGFVHQFAAVEAMGELGLAVYDLGPGSDHWKTLFASETIEVAAGLVTAPTLAGRMAHAAEGVWTLPPLARTELAGRLRNRLDQIAAMELTAAGRLRGLIDAAGGFDRRQAERRRPLVQDPSPLLANSSPGAGH